MFSCQVHHSCWPKLVTRLPTQSCSQTASTFVPAACISATTCRTLSVPPCSPRTAPFCTEVDSGGRETPAPRAARRSLGVPRAITSARIVSAKDSSEICLARLVSAMEKAPLVLVSASAKERFCSVT